MKHILSIILGSFAFLLPHHQPVPVVAQAIVAVEHSVTTPVTQPIKTLVPSKKTVIVATTTAPIVAPAPVVVPVAVPEKNPITVPPVYAKPHAHSVSINQSKITGLQHDYDDYTADIKKLKDAVNLECVINPSIPSVAAAEAWAKSRSGGEYTSPCEFATNAAKTGIPTDQAAQADILQKIQDLKNAPIQ